MVSWWIEDALSLVRCSPDHDATNGFFVSCFIRGDGESRDIVLKKRKVKGDEGRPDEESNVKRKRKKKPS